MPVACTFDLDRSTVYTICSGYVTLPEVIAHFDELERDPQRPARLHVLLDLSQITSLPESSQLRSVAERIGRVQNLTFGACAIVTHDDALYGMLRIFEVFTEPFFSATRVFRDLPSAEAWLRQAQAEAPGRL